MTWMQMLSLKKWAVCLSMLMVGMAAQADPVVLVNKIADVQENLSDLQALTKLAQQYEHAEGVSRDYTRAAELYCRAAKSGNADAQFALGWMYANGRGVPRNDNFAAELFKAAAKQGHVQAQTMSNYLAAETGTLPACMVDVIPDVVVQTVEVPQVRFPEGKVSELVKKISPRYSIDPNLVLAIISVESGFNERAVSAKNAQGLMQLLPETAERFGVKDAFNIEQNLKGGIAYLRWLLAYFKGNVALVAAAYNSGEKTVEKYRGIPPYPETVDYVRRIASLYPKATHPFEQRIVNASVVIMR